MNHKKVKKLNEEYIAKQNLKPRDLVSVSEMAQSPQKVNKVHRQERHEDELKLNRLISREVIEPRILRDENVIIGNIRKISPGAPSHIF